MTTKEKLPANLTLWGAYHTPPPDACKEFTRAGGFRGTAIDPMWLIRCATEQWGPMGDRWGLEIEADWFETLDPNHILHISDCILYYPGPSGERAKVPCIGQTWAVYPGKSGSIYDEEAPKKSRTDAVSKGLSWLGFGAAVHMGSHSGSKYVDLPENAPPETTKTDARAQARVESTTNNGPAKTVAVAIWAADQAAVYASAAGDSESVDERTAKNHLLGAVKRTAKRLGIDLDNQPSTEQMQILEREASAMIHAAVAKPEQAGGEN